MTQFGEMIAVVIPPAEQEECLFSHEKLDVVPRTNVFPPAGGKNDSVKLGDNMGSDHISTPWQIKVRDKEETLKHSPHHLIPGDESWPKTDLRFWVDEQLGKIKANIGYDVNAMENGVSLPGWTGYDESGNRWSNYDSQQEYAFIAMKASSGQFHDRHLTYSNFVIKCLNKISEKLDGRVRNEQPLGCGHDDCMGKERNGDKYNPPYELVPRLHGVASRLRGFLEGQPAHWRMPIFTSRWALAYKQGLSGKAAKKLLSAAGKAL